MKIIINASTLSGTGVTQVSVSFIYECIKHPNNFYYVLLSKTVASQIDQGSFPANFKFYVIEGKPHSLIRGISIRKKLKLLEKEINPDCVFSVFGPSVWTPTSPHLMGYAYPYYVYPESPFFKVINLKSRLKIQVYKTVHKYYLKRNGEYYVCESEDVTSRLPRYLGCEVNRVFTVTNTCNNFFNDFHPDGIKLLPKKKKNEFRFITLSSFATHKNLTILNKVIPLLKKKNPDIEFKFVLTVDEKVLKLRLSKEARENVYNLGRIDVSECPQAYFESDAMFLPTLMECFSASYPEAMKMKKPIITSDLPFATSVCGNAALYFDPLNPEDIADKIRHVYYNKELRQNLTMKGIDQLATFDTAASRAAKYLNLCRTISNRDN